MKFKTYGSADQQPLVIIHGLFGSLDNWHNVARELSNDLFIVTLDLRNHGGSDHDKLMNYEVICADVEETLNSLNIGKAHFLGHSMGGKTVMKFAGLFPGMLQKLIVADIAPRKYKPGHDVIFEAMFGLDLKSFDNRSDIENALAPQIPESGVRLFLLKNIQRRPEGGFQWKLNLPVIHKYYDRIIEDVTPDWPVSNDALFIKGENSNYITAEDEVEILQHFPNAEFVVIPHAGHWVHADNPTFFVQTVREFLL
ncbi:MAG: alpha/beta fold hydrolase [Bacteroidetes bacterium]|nr:alpha/beta fold hydrolase [Bacteroidota bacterium]